MAITFIGSATGTNAATVPAHAAGDVVLGFAFRDGSNSLPGVPAGWTTLNSGAGDSASGAVAYLVSDGTASSTSWANATSVVLVVYRDCEVGASSMAVGISTSVQYPALTLQAASAWVVGGAMHRSTNTALETPPTGMSLRAGVADATDELQVHDTNSTVSAWLSQTVAVGGTSSGWRTFMVELKPVAASQDGNASGSTLTATASLVAGSATATQSATASGSTLTASASLLAGSASGSANGTASGATLTATASLVAGMASGGAIDGTASGAVLTASASLVDGTATAGAAPVAPTARQGDGDPLSGASQFKTRRSKRDKDPRSAVERLIDRFKAAQEAKRPKAVQRAAKSVVAAVEAAQDDLGELLSPAVEPALRVQWDQVLEDLRQGEARQAEFNRAVEVLSAMKRQIEEEDEAVMLLMAG